jgi:hypothetical protein
MCPTQFVPKRRLDIERPLPMRPTQDEQTPRVARWCENVDATETDRLKGLRGPQAVGTGQLSNVVVNTSNEAWGIDGNSVEAVSGRSIGTLSGTPIDGEGDTHGEAARWPTTGTPQWAGPHDIGYQEDAHDQFPSSPSVTDAPLDAPSGVSVNVADTTASGGENVFKEGYTYHFGTAWVYDGYQEGPVAPAGRYDADGEQGATLYVVWDYNSTSPRVTDLIVYVLESPTGEGPEMPDDLPLYFVRRIPVDDSSWGSSATSYNPLNGATPTATLAKQYSSGGTDANPSDTTTATEPTSGTDGVAVDVRLESSVSTAFPDDQQLNVTSQVTVTFKDGSGNQIAQQTRTLSRGTDHREGTEGVRTETIRVQQNGIDEIEMETKVTGSATLQVNGPCTLGGRASVEEVRTAVTSAGLVYTIDITGPVSGALISGQTYQDRTGITRAVAQDAITTYEHAVSAGPYRAIAGPEIDNKIGAETTNQAYVLRSKAYRPDMFDWATDFAQVGEQVQALAATQGHVLAFCTTDTYVIERSEWRVTDVLSNVSAFGPNAYVNTGRGLVFCNANGVYLWTPQDGYRSLDGPIYEVSLPKPQYNGTVTASTFEQLTYAPDPEMVTLLYSSGTAVKGWALYLPASRSFDDRAVPYWTHLDPGLSGSVDSAYMQGGEAYAYVGDSREQLFSGGRLGWTWTSPPLRPGGYGREVTFYRADVVGTASTLRYREDESGSFQGATLSSGGTSGHPQQATINSGSTPPWKRVTRIEVEADGNGGEHLSALSLTHRPQRAAADT